MPGWRVRHIFTKVAGVSYENDDGTKRQDILPCCEPGERLTLDHQEDNKFDVNAVRVLRANGEQLGFIKARLAKDIVERSAAGYRWGAFVNQITGGPPRWYGCNLILFLAEPGVPDAEAQAYCDGLTGREPRRATRVAVKLTRRGPVYVEPNPWLAYGLPALIGLGVGLGIVWAILHFFARIE